MKTSKRILSIVLALVLLTTMVTSVFYASACNKNNHDPYKEATTVLDLIDNKLDAYDLDITGSLDGLVDGKSLLDKGNDWLTSNYVNEEKINELLYSLIASLLGVDELNKDNLDESLYAYLSSLLKENDLSKYLENGQWLIDLGNEKLAELLQEYLDAGELDETIKTELKSWLEELLAKVPSIQEIDAQFPTYASFDKSVDELLSQYIDGDKLIELLDNLVKNLIDGKLIYEENGRKILKEIDGEWAAKLDALLEGLIGQYVNDGTALIDMGDDAIMELLDSLEVLGFPVMQLRYVKNLDSLVQNMVLADGSDVMNMAANALSGLFPDVQPNYDSIVSCLVPLLSALSFDYLMGNISDIPAIASLASPTAFAYLAGLSAPQLDPEYLNTINANLSSFGYDGAPVEPMLNLTPEQQTKLLEYVEMENGGKTLAEIAEAGFDWHDFAGGADPLDIANAFVKIAIGDNNKLGTITATPGIGTALTRILCDLLNDLKRAPVTTILKKLSNAEDMAAIAELAMTFLNGEDDSFKSFSMFFDENIYYDGQGNTTFYDKLDEEGNPQYTGPKAMDQYLPVIAAAVDLLSNLSGKIDANGGDVLKTLLVDKLPQLGNLLKAAISYEDAEGNPQVGMIAYLLDEYKDYLLAQNADLSDDVLISIAQASIAASEEEIAKANAKIAKWEVYLAQAKDASDAAKLAKAKELGVLPDTATTYNEEEVVAAIEAKIATLRAEIVQLEADLAEAQLELDAAQEAYNAAVDKVDEVEALQDYPYNDPFYTDLCAIFDDQDLDLIDTLRSDCEDEFNEAFGDGKFDELKGYIEDYLADYDGDTDTFIDDWMFSDGINIYGIIQDAYDEADACQETLNQAIAARDALQSDYDTKSDELAKLESGMVLDAIHKAGDDATIYIEDPSLPAIGDFTVADIEGAIKSIQDEEIAGYEANIAAEEAKIQEYLADKNAQQSIMDNYDMEGLELEQKALNDLIDALMVFLGGDESTKSLYDYFEDKQPIEMLLAPDRVTALKSIVDGLITLFGDLPGSGSEYTTRLWEIEKILFGDKGILSTLYNDFIDDPVLSIVTRVPQLKDVVDIVYDMGFFRDIIDQYKDLIDAVANLFGDESSGFIAQWKTAYEDGSANHHYVNAILSLLPSIVNIYDQLKDEEPIKSLIAPYSDMIEYVLSLLSKDFYDSLMNNGVVATVLEDEFLANLRNFINEILDLIKPENYETYKVVVELLFDKILDGLYQDLLVDPVIAVTKRLDFVLQLVPIVALLFEFDITPYQPLIDDLRTLIDDDFTKDWKKSKLTALINRIDPLTDLLDDALGVVETLPEETIKSLLDLIPEDIRSKLPDDIVSKATTLLRSLFDDLDALAENLVNDYHKSPVTTIAKRVPVLVDMISTIISDDEVVDLILDYIKDIQIDEKTTIGDYENIIRSVISHFNDSIGPVLKDVVTVDTINLYKEDKLSGLLTLAGGAVEILKDVLADEALVDEVLDMDVIKNIQITDDMTVADIADVIKIAAAMIPELFDGIDVQELVENLLDKPVETIVDISDVLADAIDRILATDNEFINQYTKSLKNSLELVSDLLRSLSIEDGKICSTYLNAEKPLNSKILDSENIQRLLAAADEIDDFIDSLNLDNGDEIKSYISIALRLLKYVDGAVDKISTQPLFTTLENVIDIIKENKDLLTLIEDLEISGYRIGDFLDLLDPALDLLEGLGDDIEKSLTGAIAKRIPQLRTLIEAVFDNETICNIEISGYKIGDFANLVDPLLDLLDDNIIYDIIDNPIMAIAARIPALRNLIAAVFENETICNIEVSGYKIGDFKGAADLLLELLDDNIIYDIFENPIKAIFDRIDYIKAIYEWLRDFGLKDLLGDNVVFFGYNILDAVDILLPVLDTQLYYDFEQSLWKALTSSDRIGRLETALKGIIRFADIFSYSVNEGLCSLISGLCGVLDGLYDSLVLPASPANGGNQLNSTARVIVKKLPAIQNLLRSLKPLLGEGKLINLTDIISDTVKMEKDDILKAIEGVDLVKPYYYGISDVLDVVGENAAKYDWNTFRTIIDALNGVGKKLVPALEKALGVSDVQWKDLQLPTPEYKAGGTAEDYLVELSGELGGGILTPMVGTLLKAALTIPAIKDMIGDVDAEAVAGLLNDLLEFDFKDNKVEFDAFNTEHLILTGLNLVLPKTAPEPSPATADEVVMIVAVIGTTAAASTGVYFSLKKRREEMEVNA
ncbi:MAG: hypothetical protein IJJ41_08125 [Clostridia bacterium]|nr:hypothetical protein [Clostridia bacterium]